MAETRVFEHERRSNIRDWIADAVVEPVRAKGRRGAGVFVGARWSIGDRTALTFARTFYRALLDGRALIGAATAARAASRADQEFTWLVHAIHGDPLARLGR